MRHLRHEINPSSMPAAIAGASRIAMPNMLKGEYHLSNDADVRKHARCHSGVEFEPRRSVQAAC